MTPQQREQIRAAARRRAAELAQLPPPPPEVLARIAALLAPGFRAARARRAGTKAA
ncbi:hypothetical protein [Amycolatopsis pigmentata]|uniref:Uncharacterized protein n=1 Tax=Amycolatopsis pigmentata TaxID=450801 RepID=A0ABW5G5J3_9PSEU